MGMASYISMMAANFTAILMVVAAKHLGLFNNKMENGQSIIKVMMLRL